MNNDYASHLVLVATLARIIGHEVGHVVELGCGLYSTPMWLNKNIWANITSVNSYEHNEEWSRYIEYITRDNRLTIMGEFPLSIDCADVVLIDNGDNRAERLEGIAHVVKQKPSGLVILHDANEPQYLKAIEPHFEHCIVYTGAYPHTALLWNGDRFNYDEIEASIMIVGEYECPNLT